MLLYHSTSREAAAAILADGFRDSLLDGTLDDGTPVDLRGVFLSDRPLDDGDGVAREAGACIGEAGACIVITVPRAFDLSAWELLDDRPLDAYREWMIPAKMVNSWCRRLARPARWSRVPNTRTGGRRSRGLQVSTGSARRLGRA